MVARAKVGRSHSRGGYGTDSTTHHAKEGATLLHGLSRKISSRGFQFFTPAIAMVKRELLSTLRNRRYFRVMTFMLFSLLIALILYFINTPALDMTNGLAMSELSTLFFLGYAYTLYGLAMLLAPTVAANAICTEKQQEQLDLLRMSYISPSVLLLGKAASILGLFFLAVTATLPFAGVMFFFTGVDWIQYTQVLFVITMAATSATAVGLLCSSYCFRTIPAAISTYMLVLLSQAIAGGLYVLSVYLVVVSDLLPAFYVESWMYTLAAVLVPAGSIYEISMGSYGPSFFLLVLGYHGGIVLACVFLTHRLLTRPMAPIKVNQEKTIADPALLEERRKKFPYYLIDPRRRRPLIGDRQNPIFAKERYTSFANRSTTTIRILYSLAIVSMVVGAFCTAFTMSSADAEETTLGFVVVITLILLCIAPTYVATSFSKEHEWGNWDMLRMTLLTPRQVVWGKFLGGLQGLVLPACALLLGTAPFLSYIGRYPSAGAVLVNGILLLVVSVVYVLALALAATAHQRRALSALVLSYVVAILMLLIAPIAFISLYAYLVWIDLLPNFDVSEMGLLSSPLITLIGYVEIEVDQSTTLLQAFIFLLLSAALLGWATLRCDRVWYCANQRTRAKFDAPITAMEQAR